MKKGTLVYWTISDFLTTAKELEDLGFGEFAPRNDFKSAMIKSLHNYVKGNEKLYRTFNDTAKSVSFGVFVQRTSGQDLDMSKEVILHVDKGTGDARFDFKGEWDSKAILETYEISKKTLNSNQLRAAVLKYVRENHGISMRPSGGIYFVDTRFEAGLSKLKTLFQAFPTNTTLFEVPIYGDPSTLDALQDATEATFVKEIETLIAEIDTGYKKGTLTQKQIENRKEDAVKILADIKLHEENLRSKADSLVDRVKNVSKLLTAKITFAEGSVVETGEFSDLLRML